MTLTWATSLYVIFGRPPPKPFYIQRCSLLLSHYPYSMSYVSSQTPKWNTLKINITSHRPTDVHQFQTILFRASHNTTALILMQFPLGLKLSAPFIRAEAKRGRLSENRCSGCLMFACSAMTALDSRKWSWPHSDDPQHTQAGLKYTRAVLNKTSDTVTLWLMVGQKEAPQGLKGLRLVASIHSTHYTSWWESLCEVIWRSRSRSEVSWGQLAIGKNWSSYP